MGQPAGNHLPFAVGRAAELRGMAGRVIGFTVSYPMERLFASLTLGRNRMRYCTYGSVEGGPHWPSLPRPLIAHGPRSSL
jgi:hypothetical protein